MTLHPQQKRIYINLNEYEVLVNLLEGALLSKGELDSTGHDAAFSVLTKIGYPMQYRDEISKRLAIGYYRYPMARRNAPHTPTPTAEFSDAENKWCDDYAAAYNRGFDAGAKAAREEALIKFYNEIKAEEVDDDGYVDLDSIENIYCTLMAEESLRSTQQQAGERE